MTAAHLVDGSRTPGIYRVLDDPARIAAGLAGAGWTPAVLVGVGRTRDFYAEVSRALALPDYFGRNADALWDSLRELNRPTALVLSDWTRFARARPERWARVFEVLTDRTRTAPAFAVVLA